MVGPTPYLRPMRALLDQYRKVASVVLDAPTAEISAYYIGEALHHEVIEAEELRKSNLACWYALEEYRHRLHAEEVRHHLFRDVAERLNRLRRDLGIELALVGGQTEVTEALLPFLDPKVRAITETFVIDPTPSLPLFLRPGSPSSRRCSNGARSRAWSTRSMPFSTPAIWALSAWSGCCWRQTDTLSPTCWFTMAQ